MCRDHRKSATVRTGAGPGGHSWHLTPPPRCCPADHVMAVVTAVVMAQRQRPAFIDWFANRIREPDILLRAALFFWRETHNPVYVWWAIEICTRSGQVDFPDWVRSYLTECAQRMLSPDASQELRSSESAT